MNSTLVADCVEAIGRVYRHSAVGGGLHVVLDDENLDDCFLHRYTERDDKLSPAQIADEEVCLALLKRMSMTQRKKAVAQYFRPSPLLNPGEGA